MYPTFIMKTTGFLFVITGVLWAMGGLAQINPIWQFGQYEPYKISYAVQPDWYMGWLDGALRIFPPVEFNGWGHTIPFVVLIPAVLFPGLCFTLFYVWPFLEAKLVGDRAEHHLLDRPREKPRRTAIGAGALAFFFTLFAASSTDVLADYFQISLNEVLWFFRIAVFVVPLVVGVFAYMLCREMSGVPGIGKRKRAVVIVRSAEGEYESIPSEPRPGDGQQELSPEPVPGRIEIGDELEPAEVGPPGVRRIPRR
jgi:ubiquinol-cytochrome c reductase cytochrome b subunit